MSYLWCGRFLLSLQPDNIAACYVPNAEICTAATKTPSNVSRRARRVFCSAQSSWRETACPGRAALRQLFKTTRHVVPGAPQLLQGGRPRKFFRLATLPVYTPGHTWPYCSLCRFRLVSRATFPALFWQLALCSSVGSAAASA